MASRAGVTLEQLLARTLQMPRQRAAQALNTLAHEQLQSLPPASSQTIPEETTPTHAPSSTHGLSRDPRFSSLALEPKVLLKSSRISSHGFVEPSPQIPSTNTVDFQSVLDTAQVFNDWESAIKGFEKTLSQPNGGFIPYPHQIAQLITLCANCGKLEQAETALARVRESLQNSREYHRKVLTQYQSPPTTEMNAPDKVPPNADALAAQDEEMLNNMDVMVLEHLSKTEQWQAALRIVERLPKPTTTAFNAVICACERSMQWELTLKLLDKMNENSKSDPTSRCKPNAVTFAAVIASLEQAQKKSVADQVVQTMPSHAQKKVMGSYVNLINTWGKRHSKRSLKQF